MSAVGPFYQLAKSTKLQCTYSQLIYRVSDVIRILSTSRSKLERYPYSRGDPGMQTTAMQETSMGSGVSTIYGAR